MSLKDLRRMQSQMGIHPGVGLQPPCDHRGWIIPIVLFPQMMEVPGDKPGDPSKKVEFLVTNTARCINCPTTWTFGAAPPVAPPVPEAGPGPDEPKQPD